MTVEELINQLQELPPQLEVCDNDGNEFHLVEQDMREEDREGPGDNMDVYTTLVPIVVIK